MKTLPRATLPCLAAALSLWLPPAVSGQAAPPLRGSPPQPVVGERLLVTFEPDGFGPSVHRRRTLSVEFVTIQGGGLVAWQNDRLIAIDTAFIRGVKRRIGTRPASAPAMVLGSAAGFAAGFVVGVVASSGRDRPGVGRSPVNSGLSTGVLVGAPLGAFVAWVASRSRPIYQEVEIGRVRPAIALSMSGRLRTSVSIATP